MNASKLEIYRPEEFRVDSEDFGDLEIRSSGNFWYFFHMGRNALIKHFRIYNGPQVSTLVTVTLVQKGEKFEPRIRLWKRKANTHSTAADEAVELSDPVVVKASVDTDQGHRQFWEVIEFLRSARQIDVPRNPFRLIGDDVDGIAELLQGQPKDSVLAAVRAAVGSDLTEADLTVLAGRKQQLEMFREFLDYDSVAFEEASKDAGGPERAWQKFFEQNQWIFGYGLSLVSCEAFDEGDLERITTGANAFAGGGKRIDALLRTRGYVRSLVFAEIKKHTADLLAGSAYRPPDVYRASNELVGAVAQVQKTSDKAVRGMQEQVLRHYDANGDFTGIEFSTIRPRQVVIIGTLAQLSSNGELNRERVHSFELYRRSISDVEILTYDELYERASYIVGDRNINER